MIPFPHKPELDEEEELDDEKLPLELEEDEELLEDELADEELEEELLDDEDEELLEDVVEPDELPVNGHAEFERVQLLGTNETASISFHPLLEVTIFAPFITIVLGKVTSRTL